MSEEFDNYSSYSDLKEDLLDNYPGNYDFVLDKENLVNLRDENHYLGRVMQADYTATVELTDESRDWLKGIDNQTKVVVPKVFDEWLKKQEVSGPSLVSYVSGIANNPNGYPLETWIACNWQTAVKAIIDGYQVEKTKKYKVKMEYMADDSSFLNYDEEEVEFFFGTELNFGPYKTKFEKAWLRDNFEPFETLLNDGLIELIEVDD